MHYAMPVSKRNGLDHLLSQRHNVFHRHPTAHPIAKRFFTKRINHDERPVDDPSILDGQDIRMVKLCADPYFTSKVVQRFLGQQRGVRNFDGDGDGGHGIVRTIHPREAAFSKTLHNSVLTEKPSNSYHFGPSIRNNAIQVQYLRRIPSTRLMVKAAMVVMALGCCTYYLISCEAGLDRNNAGTESARIRRRLPWIAQVASSTSSRMFLPKGPAGVTGRGPCFVPAYVDVRSRAVPSVYSVRLVNKGLMYAKTS